MRNLSLIILLGLFVFLWGACAKQEESVEAAATNSREDTGEKVEGGFSHVQMEEGKVILKVEGDAVSGLGEERVTIENPRLERFFHREDMENLVAMEGQTGIWHRKSDQVEMQKGVEGIVRFEEEIFIEHADKMVYEPLSRLLTLSGRVKLRQARSTLNAEVVVIELDEEGEGIIKITAQGKVSGRIIPEELKE